MKTPIEYELMRLTLRSEESLGRVRWRAHICDADGENYVVEIETDSFVEPTEAQVLDAYLRV